MNQAMLKEHMFALFALYWPREKIVWGMTNLVRNINPQIALQMGQVTRTPLPIKTNKGGVQMRSWPSQTTMQVDLFTNGAENAQEGMTPYYTNTAVSDLTAFVNFLGSEFVDDWMLVHNITIMCRQPVRDMTELINDVAWDYRAMAELDISFIETAVGYTGLGYEGGIAYDENGYPIVRPFAQTPSQGGTKELADESGGWFEQVETEEED